MSTSKHYAAWSQALTTALLLNRAKSRLEFALRQALDDLASRLLSPLALFKPGLLIDSDTSGDYDTTGYYGDEPCDCSMCRPVGSPRQYDC